MPERIQQPRSTENVMAVLASLLAELDVDENEIEPSADLRANLGLDSTEIVQISLDLQRHFGIPVTLESHDDLTVAAVCKIVTSGGE